MDLRLNIRVENLFTETTQESFLSRTEESLKSLSLKFITNCKGKFKLKIKNLINGKQLLNSTHA
ncbi:CLUMA_CG003197, isoform A [Clunio marinus]|uniref:CLUMA_CG003197, isoform A n=1 Tax=Clunio marinus TaxID=568069 RepID=A0A1J1HPX9_9DIPT|nr:CLUMA_CG003197, isoform A [Clunio marinus]